MDGLSRRTVLAAAPALLLAARTLAQPAPHDPSLIEGLRRQLDSATGFRNKFKSGYWSVPRPATQTEAALALAQIPGRLAALSGEERTVLLLHDFDRDGRLRAWLIDATGVIAMGTSETAYAGLDRLRLALDVDSRTSTRAPVLRRAPAAAAPAPTPQPGVLGLSDELAHAATQLFPGDVRAALAASRGRLLLLSARDTGMAPIPALPLNGETRVVDRWSVLILPDLPALLDEARKFTMRDINLSRALVVGDPDLSDDPEFIWKRLPAAQAEAAEVADLIGISSNRVLLGAAARRPAVLAGMSNFGESDLIYMATHGLANSVNPMDGSFLGLGGGHLYGRDLRAERFAHWGARHPLVVMSACQSALGRTFQGGAYGMARAWILAGAAQVAASLWNVDDQATRLLMTRFADFLILGRTPEDAMRRAQLSAARDYADDPGAWASFAIMGMPASVGA
jgi:hypothetical protein